MFNCLSYIVTVTKFTQQLRNNFLRIVSLPVFSSKLSFYSNNRFHFCQSKDTVYFSSVEVIGNDYEILSLVMTMKFWKLSIFNISIF